MAKILKRLFGGNPNARKPSFAGLMYPADKHELSALVESALEQAPVTEPWRAAVVPHSDLTLVADLMALAYAGLAPSIERVVIVGPSQRVPFRGIAVPTFDQFECPTGNLPVDVKGFAPLEGLEFARYLDNAHTPEPSIELQLPFIIARQKKPRIVPILIGDLGADDVASVLDALWTDNSVLVVSAELSSDYTHDEAQVHDALTAQAIRDGDADAIKFGASTARSTLRGLLTVASKRGLKATELARCTTADLGGPRDLVRGLGVWTWT